jgi:hypothetical protein
VYDLLRGYASMSASKGVEIGRRCYKGREVFEGCDWGGESNIEARVMATRLMETERVH